MAWLIRWLQVVFLRAPFEIIAAILHVLFLLVVFPLALLLRIFEWLRWLFRTKNLFAEDKERACRGLPESVIRRPDPCLYSQTLLMSKGLPVTWDNPDVWVARADQPGNIEPDSYHLTENTDYLVSVQVHNASTDVALGVEVRLNYRPWSFNSPNLVPVETDAAGNEVVRFVDVAPMGATVTKFRWHTPAVGAGQSAHYCLQAEVAHPLDTNTANNMGQENTNVYSTNPGHVEPGELVRVEVPLHNEAAEPALFHLAANRYAVDTESRHQLRLKLSRGYARWTLSQRVASYAPALRDYSREAPPGTGCPQENATAAARPAAPFSVGRLQIRPRRRLRAIKAQYEGFDEVRRTLLAQDVTLPRDMTVRAAGQTLEAPIGVDAGQARVIPFDIQVPLGAPRGSLWPVNLAATHADGTLAGGVTLLLKVKD